MAISHALKTISHAEVSRYKICTLNPSHIFLEPNLGVPLNTDDGADDQKKPAELFLLTQVLCVVFSVFLYTFPQSWPSGRRKLRDVIDLFLICQTDLINLTQSRSLLDAVRISYPFP